MRIDVGTFRDLCIDAFEAHGFTAEEAEICAEEIVEAECRGRHSHGAAIMHEVVKYKRPTAPLRVSRETPCSEFLEGDENIGPVVAREAMDRAMRLAEASGIGLVGLNNKTPFILAGYNPRRAACAGFIGMNWSAAYSKVAVWGSSEPLIGTNPLGVAVPRSSGPPVVVDFAITEIPAAEIRRAGKRGESISPGAALDSAGKPTTDPNAALEGAMLPFGGHRGSALGVAIELLGGALVGAKTGTAVEGNRGMVFLAMKPDVFIDADDFLRRVDSFAREVEAARPVEEGAEPPVLPGMHSEASLRRAQSAGIELDDRVYGDLVGLAEGPDAQRP
jgi:L-2-hydroxycarboxylate dehydrogenase (NAD+)